jgi:hypothetical protein
MGSTAIIMKMPADPGLRQLKAAAPDLLEFGTKLSEWLNGR